MSHTEHRAQAPASVRCHVITVSDTRTFETDSGGRAIIDMLTAAGHVVAARHLVPDSAPLIHTALVAALAKREAQAVLLTGGTGIASRDVTPEVVERLLDKRLDGFGELFRMLSYSDVGAAALLSRACAGLACGMVVIALPGSPAAVRLAMEKLVLPELGHLVREARR